MRKIIYSIALLVLCLFNGSVFAQGVQQLWGTTTGGGTDGLGAIISASANGTNYQLRSSFNYTAQGRIPLYSDLIYYNSKMYGMTSEGGTNNAGVIFEWDPATNNYTKKIDLTSSNGYFPRGSLLLYNNKMYGMTISGGTNGAGVIFEWDPATNIYTKNIELTSSIG